MSSNGSPAGSSTGHADPDVALVERVRTELADILALVTATGAANDSLRGRLRPFRELHRAHLAVLTDAGETGSPAASPSGATGDLSVARSPASALHQVVRREQLTRARLADAAVAAESGTLARLLASMSAAVAQQLAAADGAGATAS